MCTVLSVLVNSHHTKSTHWSMPSPSSSRRETCKYQQFFGPSFQETPPCCWIMYLAISRLRAYLPACCIYQPLSNLEFLGGSQSVDAYLLTRIILYPKWYSSHTSDLSRVVIIWSLTRAHLRTCQGKVPNKGNSLLPKRDTPRSTEHDIIFNEAKLHNSMGVPCPGGARVLLAIANENGPMRSKVGRLATVTCSSKIYGLPLVR